MEIPIVVNEDEINVAGFVDQIDLSVDVGPPGRRGSITFTGSGTPPTSPDSSVTDIYGMVDIFEPGDLYIKTGGSMTYYAYLYIYQQFPAGNAWTAICPLQPALYSDVLSFAFTAGASAAVTIPISDIFGTDTTTAVAADFIITANVIANDTNAYALSVKTVTKYNSSGSDYIDVVLNGRQISTVPTVTNLAATVSVNLSIGIRSA